LGRRKDRGSIPSYTDESTELKVAERRPLEVPNITGYFKNLPELSAGTYKLRPVNQDDLDSMFAYLSDSFISEYTTWEFHQDISTTQSYLNQVLANYENGRVENWGIEHQESKGLVGMIGFGHIDFAHRNGEVGYVLSRKHWGTGIVSDALRLVVQEGFVSLGLEKIIGRCISENIGSKRVLQKVGFKKEGHLRRQYLKRNAFRDIEVYGLLRIERRQDIHQ
jgi:RimJ/RimL family protein N-acetyltransferase